MNCVMFLEALASVQSANLTRRGEHRVKHQGELGKAPEKNNRQRCRLNTCDQSNAVSTKRKSKQPGRRGRGEFKHIIVSVLHSATPEILCRHAVPFLTIVVSRSIFGSNMLTLCCVSVSPGLLFCRNWIWAMTLSGMYSRVRVSLIGHSKYPQLILEASPESADEGGGELQGHG